MNILYIETSGLDSGRCGIWQITAFELENLEKYNQRMKAKFENIQK